MPTVSIIMPAYNAEPFIAKAIQSILDQSFTDWELWIGDDASTDQTVQVIRQFNDPRIHLIQQPKNQGNLHTSNLLFAKCSGQFIGIQDADDWSAPERLQLQVDFLNAHPEVGLVGINYVLVNAAGQEIRCGNFPEDNATIQHILKEDNPPFVCAGIMVRKQLADQVGYYRNFFNRRGAADYDWIFRLCERTQAANIRQVLYHYLQNPSSFTQSGNTDLMKRHSEYIARFLAQQRRLTGTDALLQNKPQQIYTELSRLFIEKSQKLFWKKQYTEASMYAQAATNLTPLSLKAWRHRWYIQRHKNA